MSAPRPSRAHFQEGQWSRDAFRFIRSVDGVAARGRTGSKRWLELRAAPIHFFSRFGEFALAERFLDIRPGLSVLDIGSPKIFGMILSRRYPIQIWLTDIWEDEVRSWEALAAASSWNRPEIHFQSCDARRTGYPDDTFDRVYSISVLEHIEEGDGIAMGEICRILKPGGVAVVSVPFSRRHQEQGIRGHIYGRKGAKGEPLFLQRIYEGDTLRARLIAPSRLTVIEAVALGISEGWLMKFFAFNLRESRSRLTWLNKYLYFASLPFAAFFPALSRSYRFIANPSALPASPYYFDLVLKMQKPSADRQTVVPQAPKISFLPADFPEESL